MSIEDKRADIEEELVEQRKDLFAFIEAFKILEARCFEAQKVHYQSILTWQGADASLFILKVCIDKLTGVIMEYELALEAMGNSCESIKASQGARIFHLVGSVDD